jgi:hypothetical protein
MKKLRKEWRLVTFIGTENEVQGKLCTFCNNHKIGVGELVVIGNRKLKRAEASDNSNYYQITATIFVPENFTD